MKVASAPHSPLPWHVSASYIDDVNKGGVADCFYGLNGPYKSSMEVAANAAYIVQACNAFPALVKELQTAIAWIEDLPHRVNWMMDDPSAPTTDELLPQLRAALAQAGVSNEW